MNTMFLQMLPLLIFIVVDMIFSNTVVSIVSAVLFAVLQMSLSFAKTGAMDYFVLIDVALISLLGTVSVFLKNDLFFKLKPAIIEAVMVIFMLALLFAPDPFLLNYFGRFLPAGRAFTPEMVPVLKKMILGISIYTGVHIGAVIFTALYSSRKIWAVVSGPGYFFIFIPIMFVVILKRVMMRKAVQREGGLPISEAD
jgi:intracellular septation protein A